VSKFMQGDIECVVRYFKSAFHTWPGQANPFQSSVDITSPLAHSMTISKQFSYYFMQHI
jgi:hypothetical protein